MIKQFAKMNRKTKRKFNSLTDEEKAQFFGAVINEKASSVIAQEISKGTIAGINTAYEMIWKRYGEEIDKLEVGTVQWENKVTGLLGFLKDKRLENERRKAEMENANAETQDRARVGDDK